MELQKKQQQFIKHWTEIMKNKQKQDVNTIDMSIPSCQCHSVPFEREFYALVFQFKTLSFSWKIQKLWWFKCDSVLILAP